MSATPANMRIHCSEGYWTRYVKACEDAVRSPVVVRSRFFAVLPPVFA
jgi:hypothetical protein